MGARRHDAADQDQESEPEHHHGHTHGREGRDRGDGRPTRHRQAQGGDEQTDQRARCPDHVGGGRHADVEGVLRRVANRRESREDREDRDEDSDALDHPPGSGVSGQQRDGDRQRRERDAVAPDCDPVDRGHGIPVVGSGEDLQQRPARPQQARSDVHEGDQHRTTPQACIDVCADIFL